MRLIGMLMLRNEDWVCGLTLRSQLRFCDAVVVLIHSSTDRTHDIVMGIAKETGRVLVVGDEHEDWQEMRLRQAMLELARADGATHLWMGDGDEILTANLLPQDFPADQPPSQSSPGGLAIRVRQHVEQTPRGHILQYPLYNLRAGMDKYHANGIWGNRWVSVAFADDPQLGWRGNTFHSREPQRLGVSQPPMRPFQPIKHGAGGVLHLWGASERRLIAKHRAYRIAEALQWPQKNKRDIEQMYSMATEGRPQFGETPASWSYKTVPLEWWRSYSPLAAEYLQLDAVPWQEAWCDEMIAKHGRERFAGLRV